MADRASYYVRRVRNVDDRPLLLRHGTPLGAVAWTGPIRGRRQAERERDAWQRTGEWTAEVVPSGPQIRTQVQAWQRQRQRERHTPSRRR
jgi:hypothetical protein